MLHDGARATDGPWTTPWFVLKKPSSLCAACDQNRAKIKFNALASMSVEMFYACASGLIQVWERYIYFIKR